MFLLREKTVGVSLYGSLMKVACELREEILAGEQNPTVVPVKDIECSASALNSGGTTELSPS